MERERVGIVIEGGTGSKPGEEKGVLYSFWKGMFAWGGMQEIGRCMARDLRR